MGLGEGEHRVSVREEKGEGRGEEDAVNFYPDSLHTITQSRGAEILLADKHTRSQVDLQTI